MSEEQKSNNHFNEDGYINAVLGYGNKLDGDAYSYIAPAILMDRTTLTNLYLGNGLAKLICDKLPQEMVRNGFDIENVDESIKIKVNADFEDLECNSKFTEAMIWSGLYGGSACVLLINDGRTLSEPLNFEKIKKVESVRVYDCNEIFEFRKYQNPRNPKFGEVELWMINPSNGSQPYMVHESRMLIWYGETLPNRERQQNKGWGASKLQAIPRTLSRIYGAHASAKKALDRIQQAVHKMKDLANLVGTKKGEENVRKRVLAADAARNLTNTVVIDKDEEYNIFSQTLTGIRDLLQEFLSLLSAETGYPIFILGRQIGGLNSTGQREMEAWHNQIAAEQKKYYLRPLEKFIQILLIAHGNKDVNWTIKFNPLNALNDKEKAEVKKLDEETVKLKLENINTSINSGFITMEQLKETLEELLEVDNLVFGERLSAPDNVGNDNKAKSENGNSKTEAKEENSKIENGE